MKSKFWVLMTAILIATMVLASCTPKAAPATVEPTKEVAQQPAEPTATTAPAAPTNTPAPTEEPTMVVAPGVTKITIFVGFGTGTSPEQVAIHKQIQKEYNDTHNDIKIEFLTVPWADRITKFSTMLAGDLAPDIVMPIGVGGIAEFYDEWADLTPFIQKDNYDMTRFIGQTPKIHTYPDKGIIGLPMCVYPSVVFYNSDMFDAVNVEYPPHKFGEKYADGGAWDYTKVAEISKKLTLDKNGNNADSPAFDPKNIKQFGWDGWDWMNVGDWAQKFGSENGTAVSIDKRKSLLNTATYIDAMTWFKQSVWDWHIRANSEQAGAFYDKSGDPFGSGMVGMWEIQSWMGYAFSAWDKAFNWDVAAVPTGPNGKIISVTDADTFVIPKSSKHKDQAWEVVKWFFQNENLKKITDNYSCIPADKTLAAGWKDAQAQKFPKVDFQVFIDALEYTDTPNHEQWHPAYTKINDVISKAFDLVNTGKNMDVNAVMNEANKEAQALLDDYWKGK